MLFMESIIVAYSAVSHSFTFRHCLLIFSLLPMYTTVLLLDKNTKVALYTFIIHSQAKYLFAFLVYTSNAEQSACIAD